MTTILPSARTPWQSIDQAIGQQISNNLPGAVQQGFQRQQGLNAIDQLQSDLSSANGDISKILPALARAYTLNPNLERSGIGQLAVQQGQRNAAVNPVLGAIGSPSQGATPGMAGMASNAAQQVAQPAQAQPETSVQPSKTQPNQGLFLSSFIPQNIGELITPEQKANILSDVVKKNGDVALTRQMIDDYNQGKISLNELQNANVEKQAANVQRMLGFEDQIREKINKYVPQNTSEAEKNIYYNMVRPALESKGTTSFSDAWQKVAADIDNFRKLNEAYVAKIPEPQISGVSPAGEKQLRDSAKPILAKDPLAYNTLEQAYLQKGHSPITPAQILKPLPQAVKSTLSKAGDYKDLVYPNNFGSGDFSDRLMERNLETATREQQQEIPKLANSLRNQWDGEESLLNIYVDLKKHGWLLPNINQLLDDISDKFSPRQQAERAMLNKNLPIPTRYLTE